MESCWLLKIHYNDVDIFLKVNNDPDMSYILDYSLHLLDFFMFLFIVWNLRIVLHMQYFWNETEICLRV